MTPTHLRAARNALNLTIVQLGHATGLSYNTILRLENGMTKPQKKTMVALLEWFKAKGFVFLENGLMWEDVAELSAQNDTTLTA